MSSRRKDAGSLPMRLPWSRVLVLLVLSVWLPGGAGATEPAAVPGDFPGALEHVLRHHPEIRQAESALAAASHGRVAAYAGFLPAAEVGVTRGDGTDEAIARLALPLWRGGLNFAELDVAEAERIAAAADVQRVRLDVALRFTDAWFSTLATADQDLLWTGYIAVLQDLHGLIERRAAGGASPFADVLNVRMRMRQADAQASLNRSLLAASRAQLVSLAGGEIASPAWPPDARLLPDADIAQVPARAGEQHPELLYSQALLSRESADTRASRARLSPEVLLRHTRSLDGDPAAGDPVTELALQFQTDTGFRGYLGYRAGRERMAGARAAVDAARRDLLSSIDIARAEYEAARVQLVFQGDAVAASDAFVQSAVRQFEAGRKTWIEVLNAQREAHETRITQVQQRRVLWAANVRLALLGQYWEYVLARHDVVSGAGPALPESKP